MIIGSDKDQSRGCRRKDEDHVEFLCELYGAQVACGRYLVHEQTVQSKFENDLRDAVICHARNKNAGGRLVHVWVCRV